MTSMSKRMLRDRIMERNVDHERDREYMRDRAMDRMDRRGYGEDSRRRGSNGRYMRDRADYRDDYREDGYNDRYRDERYDRGSYRGGYHDYDDGHGEPRLRLPKEDMKRWGDMLQNEDGTEGMHFDKRMLRERIKRMGEDFEGYTEEELCMAANMLYSDYCEVLKHYISRESDKEADFYLKMAKAFLEDKDAPDGSAKLAMYFFCIADNDE